MRVGQCRFLQIVSVFLLLMGWLQAAPPSVVLVTIDTLRADRVGGEKSLTPSIDGLARDGILFTQAMAQVPITLPSHVSILTATYPMYHGLRDFGNITLDGKRQTLAEMLKKEGYRTAAFVSSFALDSQWGLDQGFDVYHDHFDLSQYRGVGFNAVERRGDETVDLAIAWLGKDASTPFFLWVHLFDPHDPYEPPEPFRSRYPGRLYDGEVAFSDAQLGRLLEALKKKGLYDSSIIVTMGDHGEGLGEHGEETHGFFIYNSTLHIPLVLKLQQNQFAGARVEELVQSVDVVPTILQGLRLRPDPEIQGRGLLGLVRSPTSAAGTSAAYSESVYARNHFGWSSLLSYQDGKYKYIRAPRPELYDLRTDPGEKDNVYARSLALGKQYDNLLAALGQKFAGSDPDVKEDSGELDPETRQRLQSLGYVALSAGTSRASEDRNLPDPKDKIVLFSDIRTATLESEKKNYGASSKALARVIAKDPAIYTARYLQGFNFFQTKQFARSVEEFKAALDLFPESGDALHSLAMSYLQLGIYDSARQNFKRLSELKPDSVQAQIGLGNVALEERDFRQAETSYRKALELGDLPRARLGLARSLLGQKQFDGAIQELQRVVAAGSDLSEAYSLLAYTYREKGMPAEAEKYLALARKSSGR